ncbi:hypothetical protein D1AOALGA4SA_7268 [Olavius algarvensis Delta 1 endosymbiont]|nr:hypothetical protein D1AOALGA4SA_7268 [Olavius algarvensis Delta 1 endosymbiont]
MVNRLEKQREIKSVHKQNLAGIIRRLYERFIMIRGEPREVALGFALGIFVGMTPTVGVQTPIAIFFAALFKWSKLSAAIGVWISNPLTVPIIYGVTYITGAKLLNLDPVFNMPLSPTWSTLKAMIQKAPQAFGAMTVGGAILGIPLAIFSYYLSYAAVDGYQKGVKDKLVRQKARLAGTKMKVKKKMEERKIHRAEVRDQKAEVRRRKSEDR